MAWFQRSPRPSANPSPSELVVSQDGPIIGWRSWRLRPDGYLLSSTRDVVWDGPTIRADAMPHRSTSNGIYAVRMVEQMPPNEVWGEVELSGVVVVGEAGYRGEVATVRSLYLNRRQEEAPLDGVTPPQTWVEWPSPAFVAELEARYGVDVTISESPWSAVALQDYAYNLAMSSFLSPGQRALGYHYAGNALGNSLGNPLRSCGLR